MLAAYLKMIEAERIRKETSYHIDIPFSVETETEVLRESGFQNIRVVEESYSDRFSAALLVAAK